ncbi:QRFP-like peptide receptor [Nematostella vectensis]|uniref:QRFP-like peptide receptor n=1 Tax=Nematostella vectensis TaxID=45351 RepID=UPI0020773A50|nr:QRFP-like peptide receptor [Nematostella vectensis]XP_048582823.1 QRFP-like peptide receptor [Nematostella vectensis]
MCDYEFIEERSQEDILNLTQLNCTNIETFESFETRWIDYVIVFLSALVVVVGVPGNVLVITVVRTNRVMRTTTNYLLVNLACSDLLSLAFGPCFFNLHIVHPKTKLTADYLCKFITGSATTVVAMTVSAITLTVIAVERFKALVLPFQEKLKLTEARIPYVVIFVWIFGLGFSLSSYINIEFDSKRELCFDFSGKFHIIRTVMVSILPAVIIAFCYLGIVRGLYWTRTIYTERQGIQSDIISKRKLCKLLVTVTVVFFLCHLPRALFEIYLSVITGYTDAQKKRLDIAVEIGDFLLFTNAALNPLIYAFNSSNYRRSFSRLCRCGRNRITIEPRRVNIEQGVSERNVVRSFES